LIAERESAPRARLQASDGIGIILQVAQLHRAQGFLAEAPEAGDVGAIGGHRIFAAAMEPELDQLAMGGGSGKLRRVDLVIVGQLRPKCGKDLGGARRRG
jgi:hypothetical protein